LLEFIDEATSRLMHLQFGESASTFAYSMPFVPIWRHGQGSGVLQRQSRRFPRQPSRRASGDGMTRFDRAVHALKHHLRQFKPGQSAGRGANKTLQERSLQDRLVKELRHAGASLWLRRIPFSGRLSPTISRV
jgi:hypothetical protein